jgi:wyosine [tRNA(Phe)-imidazoG37] synthetase (radical SAM superfamily)
MGTFLFNEIIFGPVKSRRLGRSLGINLLPEKTKYCNFDCIYCECGWNNKEEMKKIKFFDKKTVSIALETKLKDLQKIGIKPDYLTFAGNGEPTLHPDFPEIIKETAKIRDKFIPEAKIAVLSNSTTIHKENIAEALKIADQSILKLDSGFESTCKLINKPAGALNIDKLIKNLCSFKGNLTIQSMFLKGNYNGQQINNASEKEVQKWLERIIEINPKSVMIYTIDRDTPATGLEKVDKNRLLQIAEKVKQLGIKVRVSE